MEGNKMNLLRRLLEKIFGRKKKPKNDASIYPMF